jgi:hypothetical protein
MSINEIMSLVGDDGIDAISSKLGIGKEEANTALLGALPTVVSALNGNTQSKSGLNSLLGALDNDHDGGLLDNLSGFFANPEQGNGKGILKHTLGSRRTSVENVLSSKTGLSSANMGKVLEIAAPLVLSYLGREKKQQGLDGGGITSILSNLLNSNTNSSEAPSDNGLDVGDIASMFINSRKGGIGGFLQGLLGK